MTMNMNMSNDQMDKATQSLIQMLEDINSMACQSMDVAMKSAAAVSKGLDETTRSATTLMQDSYNKAISASKTAMNVKSIPELMDLQAEFMKDCLDSWIAGGGRISEISARATKEAIEPMTQYANSTISKIVQKSRAA